MVFLKGLISDDLYALLETELKDKKDVKLANLAGGNYVGREKLTAIEKERDGLKDQFKTATAICLNGYLGVSKGEIIFASPKINNAVLSDLVPCIVDTNDLLRKAGYEFIVRIIANEEFDSSVLKPILLASDGISDTSELFLRSYQLCRMFLDDKAKRPEKAPSAKRIANTDKTIFESEPFDFDGVNLSELKVGQIAQTILRDILESGTVAEEEIGFLQTAQYSKRFFDLQYPLLVSTDSQVEKARYYSNPLSINGHSYYMCSQWFEVPANNDRPYLLKWVKEHEKEK